LIPTISVLYVDDETALLDIGKLFLERTNEFAVTTASSAPAALELMKTNGIQAIVSDYQMPEMNGIEFLKQVRAMDKTLPFILFTGKGREEVVIEALNEKADFYLQKGGEPKAQFAELGHKIKAAVGYRHVEKQVTTLNRLYAVLSATNKAVVRIHDTSELLNEICRIVVETGGFAMAWAGRINPEKCIIEPVAAAGHRESYPEITPLSTDKIPHNGGPTETAVRERKFNVCNDIRPGPAIAPWQEKALRRGHHAIAAFPFACDTENAGVITYCAAEPQFFDDRIIRLLDEQARDITFALLTLDHEEKRRAAERELEKTELQYRKIFEMAQDGILIIDGDTGKIISANPFLRTLLGYPLEYFIGKHLWELGLFKDKSLAVQTFAELNTNGYLRYENLPLMTKDRRTIHAEYTCTTFEVSGRKLFQCNIRDITKRKKGDDALALARRKLNLMSDITRHDLLNQVAALSGSLELIPDYGTDAQGTANLKRLQKAVATLRLQIAFTKEYEDLGVKTPVWQQVSGIARSAVSQMAANTISVEIPDDPLEIYADLLLIKVFYNLFENARQHGGAVTRISVSYHRSDNWLIITIADNGTGISLEDKMHLFEHGFGKNTGLGLFLSREILSITGISIRETGIPGKGAQFEIAVPEGLFRSEGAGTLIKNPADPAQPPVSQGM
jgi:PAS domain S-box-containing protein